MSRLSLNNIVDKCSEDFFKYSIKGLKELAENPKEYLAEIIWEDDGALAFSIGAILFNDGTGLKSTLGILGFLTMGIINRKRPDIYARGMRNAGYAASGVLIKMAFDWDMYSLGIFGGGIGGLTVCGYELKNIYSTFNDSKIS